MKLQSLISKAKRGLAVMYYEKKLYSQMDEQGKRLGDIMEKKRLLMEKTRLARGKRAELKARTQRIEQRILGLLNYLTGETTNSLYETVRAEYKLSKVWFCVILRDLDARKRIVRERLPNGSLWRLSDASVTSKNVLPKTL